MPRASHVERARNLRESRRFSADVVERQMSRRRYCPMTSAHMHKFCAAASSIFSARRIMRTAGGHPHNPHPKRGALSGMCSMCSMCSMCKFAGSFHPAGRCRPGQLLPVAGRAARRRVLSPSADRLPGACRDETAEDICAHRIDETGGRGDRDETRDCADMASRSALPPSPMPARPRAASAAPCLSGYPAEYR